MFGFVADILTSVTSILFPVFASYKALRSSDPAQLAPWLMYWTTLSLFLAVESFFYPILSWLPFYSWFRLFGHLYLVLPGQQGSVFIYQTYIHPFLYEHEREIDRFISSSHDKAKAAGLSYAKQGVEWIKVNLLGMQPRRPTPPASRQVSYSQQLYNRFVMPSARPESYGAAGAGQQPAVNDVFSLLGNVMNQATGTNKSRDIQAEDLTSSGTLIPPHMSGTERLDYISTQRDRLRTLLQAFDNEAINTQAPSSSSPNPSASPNPSSSFAGNMGQGIQDYLLKKSRSEQEFEEVNYEDLTPPQSRKGGQPSAAAAAAAHGAGQRSGSWSKLIWGNYGEKDSVAADKKDN